MLAAGLALAGQDVNGHRPDALAAGGVTDLPSPITDREGVGRSRALEEPSHLEAYPSHTVNR